MEVRNAGAGTRPPTYGKEVERAKLKAESATATAAKRADTAVLNSRVTNSTPV